MFQITNLLSAPEQFTGLGLKMDKNSAIFISGTHTTANERGYICISKEKP